MGGGGVMRDRETRTGNGRGLHPEPRRQCTTSRDERVGMEAAKIMEMLPFSGIEP